MSIHASSHSIERRIVRREFEAHMMKLYARIKVETGHKSYALLRMIEKHGGDGAAKYLINAPTHSPTYNFLHEKNRLDLTVEAVVLADKKWHILFTPDELARATKRLEQFGYQTETVTGPPC